MGYLWLVYAVLILLILGFFAGGCYIARAVKNKADETRLVLQGRDTDNVHPKDIVEEDEADKLHGLPQIAPPSEKAETKKTGWRNEHQLLEEPEKGSVEQKVEAYVNFQLQPNAPGPNQPVGPNEVKKEPLQ